MKSNIVEHVLNYRLLKPTNTERALFSKYKTVLKKAEIGKLNWQAVNNSIRNVDAFIARDDGIVYIGTQKELIYFTKLLVSNVSYTEK